MKTEGEIISEVAGSDTLAVLSKAEMDTQITTAKMYPRNLKKFRENSLAMVTMSEKVAGECIYALPRGDKNIEGPSARFAEMLVSNWGNCKAGARVIAEEKDYVVAQGVFHDLETNVAITYEVKRKITNRQGKRYNADMIGVTANAACSIGLRNAILKGIPKAMWDEMYEAARLKIVGDTKTLPNKIADALQYLQKYGATEEMVLNKLNLAAVKDMTADHLVTLRGLATSIKGGDTTVEFAFGPDTEEKKGGAEDVMERVNSTKEKKEPDSKKVNTKEEVPTEKQDIKTELRWALRDHYKKDQLKIQKYLGSKDIDDIDDATDKQCQVAIKGLKGLASFPI